MTVFEPRYVDEAIERSQRERRERIATAVLAGTAAKEPYSDQRSATARLLASFAVQLADALIAELDK